MKKLLSKTILALLTILLMWCVISTVEVMVDREPNAEYSSWNFWTLLVEECDTNELA